MRLLLGWRSELWSALWIVVLGLNLQIGLGPELGLYAAWIQFASIGIVAQVLTWTTPRSHMCAGSNPSSPAFHPTPCFWHGKTVEDGPCLVILYPRGRPGRAPGSWFQIGTAPAIVVIWGANPEMKDFTLCVSSSLYIYDFAIQNTIFFYKE